MSAQESHRILKTLECEKYWIVPLVQSKLGLSCADMSWPWLSHQIAQELKQSSQSLLDWLSQLRGGDPSKLALFLNHESSWFRDPVLFEVLKEVIFPKILVLYSNRPIRIWSAGCAYGQEVYSLAMMVYRHFPQIWHRKIFFLATDISERVLQTARNGLYTETELFRGLPSPYKQRYFTQTDNDEWQILPEIRDKICFEQHALHESWDNIPEFDLILMRNVRLYLSPSLRPRIDDSVWQHLSEKGVWILGASELAFPDSSHWKKQWSGSLSWFEKQSPSR